MAPPAPCAAPASRWRRAAVLGRDAGFVTAETALVLPAVAVVATLLVWMLAVGAAQLRCVDAARTAAREAARGEPYGQVGADVRAAAPAGAEYSVAPDGRLLRARVAVRVPLPGPLGRAGLAVDVSGTALAESESVAPRLAVCPGCREAPLYGPGPAMSSTAGLAASRAPDSTGPRPTGTSLAPSAPGGRPVLPPAPAGTPLATTPPPLPGGRATGGG